MVGVDGCFATTTLALLLLSVVCNGGLTGTFVRQDEKTVEMPYDSVFVAPSGYNAPQQVHITQGDQEGKAVIVSWVTVDEPGNSEVHYWKEDSQKKVAEGHHVTYRYFNYNSGYIHHCLIKHSGLISILLFHKNQKSTLIKMHMGLWRQKTGRKFWSIVWMAAAWSLWIARNNQIFNSIQLGTREILDQVKVKSSLWIKGKISGYTMSYFEWVNNPCESIKTQELLQLFDTKYYYEVGIGHTTRQFHFMTPPEVNPDEPYTFGLIGDLGQTFDSNKTLAHYESNPNKGQAMLFVGDLSYADDHPNHNNVRWDTLGRIVERSAAYQPWIWTAGNHELDLAPSIGETVPFKPYLHRYRVPYEESGSTEPLWYSVKRASAHIIVLSSYSAYGKYTQQYNWLKAELPKVDRTKTQWLIVLVHAPWYNSYNYHYMEGETMRVQFESWFVKHKVDVVFAGHVHAYERTERISNVAYNIVNGNCQPVKDQSAPVYITIGDGGNIEGLATNMTFPQPEYSAYREASFGHGIFEIKNRTHAYYGWYRNEDGNANATEGDSMWFFNRYWHPVDDSTTSQHH